jgi:hypothetical protein
VRRPRAQRWRGPRPRGPRPRPAALLGDGRRLDDGARRRRGGDLSPARRRRRGVTGDGRAREAAASATARPRQRARGHGRSGRRRDAVWRRASGARQRSARRRGEARSGAVLSGRAARCPDSGFKPLRRRGAWRPRGSGALPHGPGAARCGARRLTSGTAISELKITPNEISSNQIAGDREKFWKNSWR